MLSKIFKVISAPFVFIWTIIDKLIVVNITRLFLKISDLWGDNNTSLEAWLFKSNTLVFLSLFISLMFFFLVNTKAMQLTQSNADVLHNQPVVAIYNKEAYVIDGIPKTVDVTLIGSSSDLYLAKQLPESEIKIDLSNLSPGTHKVNLKYNQPLANIKYRVDPSVITVVVHPKVSTVKTLSVELLNQDTLDPKLVIQGKELSKDQVVVKGSEEKLERIASVKALIDVNTLRNVEVGKIVARDIPLAAYDQNGTRVKVEIVPKRISATLDIASPSKSVPIKIIPAGNVAFGKAINTITSSVTNITIYGDETALKTINFVPVKINVAGIKSSKDYNVLIKKPVGVRHMSSNNASVSVTLGTETTKEINNVYIEYKNLAPGLNVQATSAGDTKVSVILKGVKTVVDKLDATQIQAYVDLAGYSRGTHTVPVKVTGEDLRVNYQPKVSKITLKIN